MTEQPDPELWAAMTALHDLCERRGIDLVAAARIPGAANVINVQVGSPQAVDGLVRGVLAMTDEEVRPRSRPAR